MKEDHYILLIQKQLAGDISAEEQSQLDAWLHGSVDHQQIANSIKKTWELSRGFSEEVDLDLDADFQKIESRLEEGKPTAKVRPLLHRNSKYRLAAAFLILLAGWFVWDNFLTPAVKYQVASTADQPFGKPIELVDGSKVWLNSHSRLTYFMTSIGKERRIKIEGEAFLEVAKDANKPFVVELPTGEVTVLGTSFSVFENEEKIEVTVATGKVKLEPLDSESSIVMEPGQKGLFDKKRGELRLDFSDNMNEMSWHTKQLVFVKTPLNTVLSRINEFYKTPLEIENEKLRTCPINVTFDNNSIESVVETLSTLLGASKKKKVDGGYVLKGGQCQ